MIPLVRATALLCLAALAGCSVYSTPGRQPAPVETRPGSEVVSPQPAPPAEPRPAPQPAQPPEPNASNAYGPLLARADKASAGGDYEQALALLERAQRIDPDSAEVYLALARTYAAKGDNSQARATAERGLLYCRSNSECGQLRALAGR
ncbi:tetratricopeptide repeat protein [Parahaliea mediterranea]|uniref:Tetratricopeptide repeat protein n=1 Tax=Parahaliea mediterranea TaxID=651086 RepID=A0A939IP10_9GAMM|nr:tetratricopeptide repeat protein [Parahaliea mediterranea]MBN7799110.1 tetratricopeptide repeat protein [Parahaliea mediterranea]